MERNWKMKFWRDLQDIQTSSSLRPQHIIPKKVVRNVRNFQNEISMNINFSKFRVFWNFFTARFAIFIVASMILIFWSQNFATLLRKAELYPNLLKNCSCQILRTIPEVPEMKLFPEFFIFENEELIRLLRRSRASAAWSPARSARTRSSSSSRPSSRTRARRGSPCTPAKFGLTLG